MLIRQIQSRDDAAVAAIIQEVMTEFGAVGQGFSIEDPKVDAMSDAFSGDRSRFYVVEHESELVGGGGIAQLLGGDSDTCELKKMYFRAKARGRGIGRLLAETLLQDAARFGFRKVYVETLDSMTAANRLYQKLGFSRLERSLGRTGHCGCNTYYVVEVEPLELDPSLLR